MPLVVSFPASKQSSSDELFSAWVVKHFGVFRPHLSKWFFDQEISFAIGFGYAIPNLCSFGAGWWVPGIAADPEDDYLTRGPNGIGIGYAMGTSALVCLYSWLAGILLIILDKRVN